MGCDVVSVGDRLDGVGVVGRGSVFAGTAGDREERHVGDVPLRAQLDQRVLIAAQVDRVAVLDAHDRRDRERLVDVVGADVRHPELTDQPGVAQVRERAEPVGDRVRAGLLHDPQVDHVETVDAELPQVRLHLRPQLGRGRRMVETTVRVLARPDLGGDDQTLRVRRQRLTDQLVRVPHRPVADPQRPARRHVERRRVDVIHAELHRATQYADRHRAIGIRGDPHRTEAHPVDGDVAQFPGTGGGCTHSSIAPRTRRRCWRKVRDGSAARTSR